jgi:uncharacterized membrane protein SpoIIM required for sporulation/ABC-type transport system involved in multi-copper enzyme maturation permease subunit
MITDVVPEPVVAPAPEYRSSLKRALIITRRELLDGFRDWRTVGPVVTLTVVAPLIALLAVRVVGGNFIDRLDAGTFENRILPLAVLAVGFLPMSFSLIVALETFVGEKERNSLEALMTAPLTDLELFTGKFIASLIPPIVASCIGSTVFVIGIMLTGGPLPASIPILIMFLFINVAQALVMVSGAVIVSSHATSVRGANLLASFVIIPVSIVIQIEAVILLVGDAASLVFVLIVLLIVFVLLLRTGVRLFNREEIVAREADTLNFKAVIRNIGRMFARTPQETLSRQNNDLAKFSIWRLYSKDIPQILKMNAPDFWLIVLILFLSSLVGWWVSSWREFQPLYDFFAPRLSNNQEPFCTVGENILQGTGISWWSIFTNNVVATLIASAIAFFTLGVGGISLIMVAVAPIGTLLGVIAYFGYNPFTILAGFVLPHGIIELPIVAIAVAAAMKVGTCFVKPPKGFTVGQNLQFRLVNYIKLLPLVVPLLLIAAIIEANYTPTIGCWLTGGGR